MMRMMKASGGDPYAADVVLLLHGQGTNGGTDFTDSSPTPKTFTAFGNANTSTAQFKYGTSSMYFDGAGDYITTPDHADFTFGTGPFTAEALVRFESSAVYYLFGQADSLFTNALVGLNLAKLADGTIRADIGSGETLIQPLGTSSPALNTFHHVAVVRSGNVFTIYVNGIAEGSVTNTGGVNDSAEIFAVGRAGAYASLYFNGYQHVRITKAARYTTNFTPPTTFIY
jgi:hypothetical protein